MTNYTIDYSDGTTATVTARTPDHARQLAYRVAGSRTVVGVR